MAVRIYTGNPKTLLEKIKKAIDKKHIITWSYDDDGDFTHTADQWKNRAWLKPFLGKDSLDLGILNPKETKISTPVYAIYHGRFIEMVLTHFDEDFTTAYATALPEKIDSVSS